MDRTECARKLSDQYDAINETHCDLKLRQILLSWNLSREYKDVFNRMFSPQLCFFLYFINYGFVKETPNQSQRMHVDKLDAIEVEEESCQEDRRRGSRQKCKRKKGKNYDANETRTRRRGWFGRNKIAPIVLPTTEEGPSGEGSSGTQRQQNGSKPEIFDNKPMEASDDHVVIDFCETQDSFLQRKNGALALQSFATCARLNENFMRKAAWTPKEVSDSDALDNEKALTSSASFPSKVSNAWKVFRRSISRRDANVFAQREPGTSLSRNTSEARETMREDPTHSKNSQTQFRRKSKQGNSSKTTSSKPVHGIQELGDDSTFDRDLYMQINNLAVTHDTGQFALRDPFLIQEEIPTLSEVPLDYLTTVLEDEDSRKSQSKTKSRWSGFLARVKRRKN